MIAEMINKDSRIHANFDTPLIVEGYELRAKIPPRITMLQMEKANTEDRNLLKNKHIDAWIIELQCIEQAINSDVLYHLNIHEGVMLGFINPPEGYFDIF